MSPYDGLIVISRIHVWTGLIKFITWRGQPLNVTAASRKIQYTNDILLALTHFPFNKESTVNKLYVVPDPAQIQNQWQAFTNIATVGLLWRR